jgi:Protein of unknown function (DUF1501)
MDRRQFFSWVQGGLAGAAAASLLSRDGAVRGGEPGEATPRCPHFSPKAMRALHICLCGAMSHLDTFDYKPGLIAAHGKPVNSSTRPDTFFGKIGRLRRPDWTFRQRGESGLWVSELFPNLAEVADELTVIKSMVAETSNHTPATFQENSGFRLNGFPCAGAWLSYGLGSESEDLPAFVVIPDAREFPAGGAINWTNGFLPARHQGVVIRPQGEPIDDLFPASPVDPESEAGTRELVAAMNRSHIARHSDDDALAARMRGYAMAARMQTSVPLVADVTEESGETLSLYGIDRKESAEFGRACLLARRLLERGVRFVQVYSGGTFGSPRRNWDGHEDMKTNHGQEAGRVDRPLAGLLRDFRRRGLLEDTLVVLTTEFGRTPFSESGNDSVGLGRDHNPTGFCVWLAGAGLKHGMAYGSTDEIGWKAAENVVTWPDFHATVLHLLGIDHKRLTFYHNGIQRRLTNVHGEVIKGILA